MKKIGKTSRFKKDWKKYKSGGHFDGNIFTEVVSNLASGYQLDPKYKDHSLSGNMNSCRECHLKPDLLLIYEIKSTEITLMRIGNHSELF
ncbi:MAG: type II toxin-antitoxin system YafQ family toxin [Candidatus Paceibacterota bacterium]